MPNEVKAPRYDLMREYRAIPEAEVGDDSKIDPNPCWLLAVVRLNRPVSWSRSKLKSLGTAAEGAFTRQSKPLLISDDCVQLTITNSKRSHVKQLSAILRQSDVNYLSSAAMLPGDWLMAWMFNNQEDLARITRQLDAGLPCNDFADGLKFIGRVQDIFKDVNIQTESGHKISGYELSGIGFAELDTEFFYDPALASAAFVHNAISNFMGQIGLRFSEIAEQEQMKAGQLKDNADKLIVSLVDLILGKGLDTPVNLPEERAAAAANQLKTDSAPQATNLRVSPQANKEAPFAYLVPRTVGTVLGREPAAGTKNNGIFGYSDIMETLVGVQDYDSKETTVAMFTPRLRPESTVSRKACVEKLKGTFVPVNPSFVNRPLWQLLQQFLNPVINEMYMALRTNERGEVVPTMVVRQIPFSTNSANEHPELRLTRFLNVPRWVVHPTMCTRVRVGRSDATRCNMMHVYGEALNFANNSAMPNQLVRNPPLFDELDIQRSGMRAQMKTVNCSFVDQLRPDGARVWMEAVSDWSFGSQYTLSGIVEAFLIQSPIPEGDNIELEGIAYHIETIMHRGWIGPDGKKDARTTLQVSNGMPVNQDDATDDFPRYPGFTNVDVGADATVSTATLGDPDVATSLEPGITRDSTFLPGGAFKAQGED
jgi:hypothetical protein